MPDAPNKQKPQRWRWWLRWLLLLTVLALLALISGAWWAYENRTDLANRLLSYLQPYGVSVVAFDVDRAGNFTMRDLKVVEKETQKPLLHLPAVKAKIAWANALSGHIENLTLEQPMIQLEQAQLEQWLKPAPAPSAAPAETTTEAFAWRVDQLQINEAKLKFTQSNGVTTETAVTYQGEDLALLQDALSSGEQELTLTSSVVKTTTQEAPPLSLPRLHVQGRIKEGIVELDHLAVQDPALQVTPELLAMFGVGSTAPPVTASSSSNSFIKGVHIGEVLLKDLTFKAAGFREGNATGLVLPDAQFQLNHNAKDLRWGSESGVTYASAELLLNDYSFTIPEQEGQVKGTQLSLKLGAHEQGNPWLVDEFTLTQPQVNWNKSWSDQFLNKKETAAQKPAAIAIKIQQASIIGADLSLADTSLLPFHLKTRASMNVSGLELDANGLRSGRDQSLSLSDVALEFPAGEGKPTPKPFFTLEKGELVIQPDAWNAKTRIEKLALTKPLVHLRDGNTPWLEKAGLTATPPKTDPLPSPAATEKPLWQKISFGSLTLDEGQIDVLAQAPKPVDAKATIQITTEGENLHRVAVQNFAALLPTLSRLPFPVASATQLEVAVKLPQMWEKERVEELKLQGASIEAGEALMGLFEPEKSIATTTTPLPAKEPAAATPLSHWSVGKLQVSQSTVTVVNLVPGFPALKFGVAFEVNDAPLQAEDLAKNVATQRVELADIFIPSPYESLRPVAELDSIFLHFTLDGLLRKEIDRVEIVSPTLYVGEDLFWYVDYYRKYAQKDSKTAPDGPEVAATGDDALTQKLAAEVVAAEPAASQAAWSVRQLQVHSGKLVLAPKGKPLKGFRQPFPFNIDTEVVRGTLQAELLIPTDTYTIEEYKLQFEGMRGGVLFNLPMKQKDNNMVETFEVDSIRWKDLRTGKAYLTVTYDALGIYSKFGAEAYEGYVNGELNVYLDDNFHWDGWLGTKNLQTKEITQKVCPGYFMMDGSVEATLVAQGSKDELYQADGSFKNHAPGRFSIAALNDLVEGLPGDWTHLERQIAQMGVDTFRDFDYDTAEAKCRFYGREGTGFLHFIGPKGSRKFDVNVYDHRWKIP